jgi:hypothetical protein
MIKRERERERERVRERGPNPFGIFDLKMRERFRSLWDLRSEADMRR